MIYDKRLAGFEDERILDVDRQDNQIEISTTGNSIGVTASRLRYVLVALGGTWTISDLQFECPICHATGLGPCIDKQKDRAAASSECRTCKGRKWISTKGAVDGLLEG